MPIGLAQPLAPDLEAQDQAAAALPTPQGLRYGQDFSSTFGQFTNRALQFGKHLALNTLGLDPADPSGDIDLRLPSDVANQRYGVDGYLRFNQPTTAEDAAWMSAQAHDRRFRDIVLSRTRPNPLLDFGASLAGTLLDPAGLGVMAASGPLGDVALLGRGAEAAGETGQAISTLGRVANAATQAPRLLAQGALVNAPYIAADAALSNYAGDEYGMGDALRDIAAGAILHTGLHFVGAALGAHGAPDPTRPGRPASEAWAPPAGVPEAVQDLSPLARKGAFVKAVDDLASDRPVDVGQHVDRALNPEGLSRLDEARAEPSIASFRPLDDSVAVTPRGGDVPVRYGLVELRDLVTSHTDDLQPNPAFPPELQPRARDRAGAIARNVQLEADLNPKLLMRETSAASGAPIVSPGGVVESGNGRTIALRRSAAAGGEAWGRYQAELKAQGFDTTGMQQPVLVRLRTQALDGPARAALARDMNADVTERMSAAEQAMADAQRIPDGAFDLVGETETAANSRRFARAFIEHVAPGQENALTGPDGQLSQEGARRIKAAVLARAYGDQRLVGQMFEDEGSRGRQLAEGMAQAAPAWAKMRALAAVGDIPPELDLTQALTSAMDLVRHAQQEGVPLGDLIAERLGQKELFGGEAISPATEAFLRLGYQDQAFKRPVAADKFAFALKDYARQASEVKPGPDLFGETAGENTSRQILDQLAQRFARGDAGELDLRAPGRASDAAAARAAEPPVIDLRRPGEPGDGGGGGVSPPDGGGAEGARPGAGGDGQPEGGAGRLTGLEIIAADPELKALVDDTERYAAIHGVDLPAEPKADPDTLAEAIRAAAFCLAEESQ